MKARRRIGLLAYALEALDWLVHRLDAAIHRAQERRPPARAGGTSSRAPAERAEAPPRAPEHADERTMRRVAEAQAGGLSSQESAARYVRGENPGGTHQKAAHRGEGPLHQRPEDEEPQERKETVPGKERHIAVTRKGS